MGKELVSTEQELERSWGGGGVFTEEPSREQSVGGSGFSSDADGPGGWRGWRHGERSRAPPSAVTAAGGERVRLRGPAPRRPNALRPH